MNKNVRYTLSVVAAFIFTVAGYFLFDLEGSEIVIMYLVSAIFFLETIPLDGRK